MILKNFPDKVLTHEGDQDSPQKYKFTIGKKYEPQEGSRLLGPPYCLWVAVEDDLGKKILIPEYVNRDDLTIASIREKENEIQQLKYELNKKEQTLKTDRELVDNYISDTPEGKLFILERNINSTYDHRLDSSSCQNEFTSGIDFGSFFGEPNRISPYVWKDITISWLKENLKRYGDKIKVSRGSTFDFDWKTGNVIMLSETEFKIRRNKKNFSLLGDMIDLASGNKKEKEIVKSVIRPKRCESWMRGFEVPADKKTLFSTDASQMKEEGIKYVHDQISSFVDYYLQKCDFLILNDMYWQALQGPNFKTYYSLCFKGSMIETETRKRILKENE